MQNMKISVITPCFNSSETIIQTIDSVLSQKNVSLEYILVDAGSTDNTIGIVEGYGERVAKFVSEPDSGIYDALNKGLSFATGDIIAILNSDDFYADDFVLYNVLSLFRQTNADAVYGDLEYVDKINTKKVVRRWRAGGFNGFKSIKRGWCPPHPSFFVKREIYEKHGNFINTLSISADYELMLRFLHFKKITVSYLPKVLVKMRLGGISNASIQSRIYAYRQDKIAWALNGQKPPFGSLLLKRLSKIKQWFL